ncbi:MAG: VOC family protein [Sporolactobacillus sp.]|uniref:SMU1112c/YaeR family gloxylase I-like metalloprotein n=1 Tax=Sporolactobacillus sp. STSJ-5 TaxID=2965076 RepID=UPI00210702AB|nr:VOC family protein [Sporolactobacillus sp. STSJ-5]MCQ2010035.1 VOC family protein [Sporolactobacillus sp. STSJ-5]
MDFKGIHHCAIICSNYERSKHFYVDLLGLSVINEIYREDRNSYKLDLAIGNGNCGQIELFSFTNPPQRSTHPEACGLRHLALSVDDLEKTVTELNDKEIETEPIRVDPITGKKFTFFRDPDDLPLELYQN